MALTITFTTSFTGAKNVYMQALDAASASSGWQTRGSWTVPGSTVEHVITIAPAGLSLTVDGAPCTAPCTFQWTAGTQHTIATTTPQAGSTGTRYVFSKWSDGGAISHSITASSPPATYTANFTTQYYLTTAASPPAGGTISPASSWRNSGSVVSVSATANTGYQFTGFTGALTGTTTPQNLTMNAPRVKLWCPVLPLRTPMGRSLRSTCRRATTWSARRFPRLRIWTHANGPPRRR